MVTTPSAGSPRRHRLAHSASLLTQAARSVEALPANASTIAYIAFMLSIDPGALVSAKARIGSSFRSPLIARRVTIPGSGAWIALTARLRLLREMAAGASASSGQSPTRKHIP